MKSAWMIFLAVCCAGLSAFRFFGGDDAMAVGLLALANTCLNAASIEELKAMRHNTRISE
jgi:hypothetical protein